MVHLLNYPHPILRLPAILDYHALYPHLQTTATYNLLLNLCLRHRTLGPVQSLLENLRKNGLSKTMETYKLEIRWFIYRGRWDAAWNYVQTLTMHKHFPRGPGGQREIPYPLWVELCRAPAARQVLRTVRKKKRKVDRNVFDRTQATSEEILHRLRLLEENKPASMPALGDMYPIGISFLVRLLILAGKRRNAEGLINSYLNAIPRDIDAKMRRRCLSFIHAYIATIPEKVALAKVYEARRTLIRFLKQHPRIRPNSQTLCILLRPLRRARACGTVALKVLNDAKAAWGRQVEDRRVRRLVADLALKEGRMDVVTKMLQEETSEAQYRRRRLLEERMTYTPRRIIARWRMRNPLRRVYPRNGREARLWYRLRARIRYKSYRRTVKTTSSSPPT